MSDYRPFGGEHEADDLSRIERWLRPRTVLRGPRMIGHVQGGDEPVLDPRIVDVITLAREGVRRERKMRQLRAAFSRGEVAPAEVSAYYEALNDYISWYAWVKVQIEPSIAAGIRAWSAELPDELRRVRMEYMQASQADATARRLLPVAVNGSTRRGAAQGYFKTPLGGGAEGYLQRRSDDCLRAALATTLGRPMPTLPDISPDRLQAAGKDPEEVDRALMWTMGAWSERNALTVKAHVTRMPVTSRGLWIGLAWDPEGSPGHCLILKGRNVIFDTAWLVPPGKEEAASCHSLDDVQVGLTIEKR